jgi:hypothetical protein
MKLLYLFVCSVSLWCAEKNPPIITIPLLDAEGNTIPNPCNNIKCPYRVMVKSFFKKLAERLPESHE